MTPEPGSRVLAVGVATLDLINEVADYPPEDAEVRALAQRRARGGNATNTLAVLAQLGWRCAWSGTLADDAGGRFIAADLARRGIALAAVERVAGAATPTSYVTLSRASGSRTIVHHRDLPELDAAGFARVGLDGVDWVHFEGRNPAETAEMMRRVRRLRPLARVSVELEKPRPGVESLAALADLVLVGRDYARAGGGETPARALATLAPLAPQACWVLGWGEGGAWSRVPGADPRHHPALPLARVVDSLGAGDCLNAGVIDGLLRGLELAAASARAVRLAGFKCARPGLDDLIDAALATVGVLD
ncbi:PfkB family carbohydrate kinase [Marichromatium gracile]|uniref:PfkB family carbohydrate kinase n=1 Tax=Marichromatium gracile TaxID=1048 RepID=UPI001F41E7CF|nr:PfkB family carbohydrate kinase [Marichromatium gracile]MCF1183426.1 PfkB family carbohydrate kinase [Marichromatium gracile]